ncbi:MAG: hypothetical protein N2314_08925 [Brevinematales bacterium]|nr:hypothetical protein [Brevinematales bacterium]
MKGWRVLGIVIVCVWGCGFVVEDREAKTVDYVGLVSYLQPLTNAKGTSYGISTSGTNEISPQVYHAPWGKSYFFFVKGDYPNLPYALVVREIFVDGSFGKQEWTIHNGMMGTSYCVFDGESNGMTIPVVEKEGGMAVIQPSLSLSPVVSVVSPGGLSALSVWNGSRWEMWAVYRSGANGQWYRFRCRFQGTWGGESEVLISSSDVLPFLASPLGGVGVVSEGETNFVLLRVTEPFVGAGIYIFQQLVISLKAGEVLWETNRVYSVFSGVNTPFVERSTYEVYFSMRESAGTRYDLYRFRYLTWDKLIPVDLRRRFP